MNQNFKFECPKCGFASTANKDLSGRLKKCGKCGHTYTIAAMAADGTILRRAEPDPELAIDQVFSALHAWEKHTPSLAGAFGRDVSFGHFEPAYRVTLKISVEENGQKVRHDKVKETLTLPPALAEAAGKSARTVADIQFESPDEVVPKLPGKDPGLRRAAQELLATAVKPPNLIARHLLVEHLNTWKAHWVYHELEGTAWFTGRPLKLFLSNPPRQSPLKALAAVVLGIGAVAAIVSATRTFWREDPSVIIVQAPAPAPVAPKPEALQFAKDGIVQREDGTFLRGALERKDEAVLVSGRTVPVWEIDSVHLDAAVFLRNESRRLEELEGRGTSAKGAKRETLVNLFLEIHLQRERWGKIGTLCAASELPAPPPMTRLEALRAEIEKLLEKTAPAAVAPAATPDTPKPAELTPAVRLAGELLAQIAGAADADARGRIAGGLEPLKAEKLPQGDLIHLAALHLSRSENDQGLVTDRVHLKTAQVDSTFEGAFEKKSDVFVHLKTASGQDVTAYKEKDAWVAQVPGGIRLDGVQVTVTPAARTESGEKLREAFDRLPPARWMSATGAEHLKAAKDAVAALERKGTNANDRGLLVVRALAAAHAAAALRAGSPAEILEARGVLHGLGYAPTPEGRWERAEDRRALQLGQLLKDSKAAEARTLVPAGRSGTDFVSAYRATVVQLQAPLKTRDDLDRAGASLDNTIGRAFTTPESRHLLALKTVVSSFGICRDCGGGPAKICMTCRGKGQRTEACAPCRGQGYIITVGIGATGAKTCESCGGKPIKGTRPCERCEGKGTRSCAKCQGIAKLPAPADLGRLSPCGRCAGKGGHGDLVHVSCPSCAGMGVQLKPAGAPDLTLP